MQETLRGVLTAVAVMAMTFLVAIPSARAAMFNAETFTLGNGLQVVVISNHRAPVVTQMVWYKIGSADEQRGKTGIAHLLEHMMFKGTPSEPDFSRVIGRIGARDNAFTSYDYTGYFQNVASDRLETVMRLEADRMTNLILTDKEFIPERLVVLEERRSSVDSNPRAQLREAVNAALYLNHPYGKPIIGYEHEIKALTTQDAVDWYRRYYAPNNAVLIVAGDVTMAKLKPLAEKYYGAIPARPVPERVRVTEPPITAARRVELRADGVREPSWSRLFLAPSDVSGTTEHAYPLEVAAEILGGSVKSRLHKELVVKQKIATSAGSRYDSNNLDYGTFGLFFAPVSGVELTKVEAAMEAVIAGFLTEGPTVEEVEEAKARMVSGVVYALDSMQAGARVFGSGLTTGRSVAEIETWPERIAAVTRDQVLAGLRAVLGQKGHVTALLLPKATS